MSGLGEASVTIHGPLWGFVNVLKSTESWMEVFTSFLSIKSTVQGTGRNITLPLASEGLGPLEELRVLARRLKTDTGQLKAALGNPARSHL